MNQEQVSLENSFFITNNEHDDRKLLELNSDLYMKILQDRDNRRKHAFLIATKGEYQQTPLPLLQSLQARASEKPLAYYEKHNHIFKYNERLIENTKDAQDKINNQQYCQEGTPEWQYRLNYLAAWENFKTNWPDATEIAIREQEKHLYQHLLDTDDLSD